MQRKRLIIYLIDMMILTGSFLIVALYKPSTAHYLSNEYLNAFGILLVAWTASSFYFKKYNFRKKLRPERMVMNILVSNFVSLGVILVFIVIYWVSGYSRLMLFGTIGLATLAEIVAGNLYCSLIRTRPDGHRLVNPPATSWEIKSARTARDFREQSLSCEAVRIAVEDECGPGIHSFMCRHLDPHCSKTLLLSTSSRFNVEMQHDNHFNAVVNMKRVNDIRYINKFFESVNRKMPEGGKFIGCAETKDLRKKRIMKKYPPVLNRVFYAMDFILKRVFPKFILTRKIYYLFTRGNNRVISRAELLGRLYSCGFMLIEDAYVKGLYCFCAGKATSPVYDFNPTYGMFIKLNRVGRDGKIIRVYKFRTMHPYAEYLQDYLFENNSLEKGGKYRNDFRVTTLGRVMRTFWIDELPMIFNLLKGEVKLVGIRPISVNYFNLYHEELRERRIKYKPGLVPPFYVDLPKTLEEIQESESRYLDSYDRSPLLTDIKYFSRAMFNIVFRKVRSR